MSGPSYRFRLERVRALRERREEQVKQEFAVALQARQHRQDEVARTRALIDSAYSAQSHAPADDLGTHQTYLERLEHALELELEDLTCCEVELTERRVELTKASQDLEALERLKEKGRDDHNREAARVEQNLLDEIAGNGYWRRAA
ncbi:MAG: flagellar export protein FliJ [Solirubrobacteraceae bacterium]